GNRELDLWDVPTWLHQRRHCGYWRPLLERVSRTKSELAHQQRYWRRGAVGGVVPTRLVLVPLGIDDTQSMLLLTASPSVEFPPNEPSNRVPGTTLLTQQLHDVPVRWSAAWLSLLAALCPVFVRFSRTVHRPSDGRMQDRCRRAATERRPTRLSSQPER